MATKKCPFCAEEIQAEAIKCRFCQSWLNSESEPVAPQNPITAAANSARAVHSAATDGDGRSKVLFQGVPSWKAYLKSYALIVVLGLVAPFLGRWVAGALETGTLGLTLYISVPIALAVVALFGLTFYRRSLRYRITSTNIETEYGILQKRIDNLELWRCRDIRYNQSLLDRILQIAHIQIFTADVTSPEVFLRGMPASRRLFEQLRDAVEIQRQARNVIGMVQ